MLSIKEIAQGGIRGDNKKHRGAYYQGHNQGPSGGPKVQETLLRSKLKVKVKVEGQGQS